MNALRYRVIFSKTHGALVAVGENTTGDGKTASGAGNRTRLAAPHIPPAADASWASIFHGKLRAVAAGLALMGSAPAQAQGSLSSTALPTNGVVSTGSAVIGTNGSTMTIQQHTDKASINWTSFNVGSAATVNIRQRTSNDVLLNRVVGNDPSQIMGKINANGKVLLVNPNGIVFGKDGMVRATAFTAGTFGITDEDFKNGNYRFNRNGTNAGVVNNGTITTEGEGNYVALVGATVTNDGRIAAKNGDVVLAAGESVSLPTSIGVPVGRSGRIRLQLSAASINAAVSNTANGVITTEGGQVLMQAAAVGDAIASVVMAGKIDSTAAKGGAVTLQADHGLIKADGSITANSTGAAAGGDIMIGRDTQTEILARQTDVSNAHLESKGGFVETSGDWLGTNDTRVKAKDWLLDPTDITIVSSLGSATPTPSSTASNTTTWQQTNGTGTSAILASTIASSLGAGTNVTIKTTNSNASSPGNITVASSIDVTGSGGDATLTLMADGKITVNALADIKRSGSNKLNLVLDSAGVGTNGGIQLNASISANEGTVTMKAGAGTTSTWDFANPDGNAVKITADKLELLGTGANFVLNNPGNSVNTLAANTGSVTFSNNKAITIGTVNGTTGITANTGAVTVTASGQISVNNDITAVKGVKLAVSNLGNDASIVAAAGTTISNTGVQGGITLETYRGDIAVANLHNNNANDNIVISAGYNWSVNQISQGNVTKVGAPVFSNNGGLYIYTGSYSGFGDIKNGWNGLTKDSAGFSTLYANNPYKANNVGFGKTRNFGDFTHTALDMTGNQGATSQVVFREAKTLDNFNVNLSSANNAVAHATYGTAPTSANLASAVSAAYTGSSTLTQTLGANNFTFHVSDVINDLTATLPALTSATQSSSGNRIVGTYDYGSLGTGKTLTGVTVTAPTGMKLVVDKKKISVSGIAASDSIYGNPLNPGAASFATGDVITNDKVTAITTVQSTPDDLSTGGKLRAKFYSQTTGGLTANTDDNSSDAGNYELIGPFTTAGANYEVKRKVISANIGAVNVDYGTNAVGTLSLGSALVDGDQVNVTGTVTNSGATNRSGSNFIKARDTAYDQSASNMALTSGNLKNDAENYTLFSTTATAAQSYKVNRKDITAATIGTVTTTYGSNEVGALSLGSALLDGDKVNVTGTVIVANAGPRSTGGFVKASDTPYDQAASNVKLTNGDGKNDADNYRLINDTASAAASLTINKKVVDAATISTVNATYGTELPAGTLSLGTALMGSDSVIVNGTVTNAGDQAANRSTSGFIKANLTGYDQTATGVYLTSGAGNNDANNYILKSTTATAAQSYKVAKKEITAATLGALTTTYGSNAVGALSVAGSLVGDDKVNVTGTVIVTNAGPRSTGGFVKASETPYDQAASNVKLTSGTDKGDADNYSLINVTASAAASLTINKKEVDAATISTVNATYGTALPAGTLSLGNALMGGDSVIVNGTVTNAGDQPANRSTSGFIKANPTGYDQTATGVSLTSGPGNNDAENYLLKSTTATAAQSYKVAKKDIDAATIGAVKTTYGSNAVGALSVAGSLVGDDKVNVTGTVSVANAGPLSTGGFVKASGTPYDQAASNVKLSSGNDKNDAGNYNLVSDVASAAKSLTIDRKVVEATIDAVNATYGTNVPGTLSLGSGLATGDKVTVSGTVTHSGANNLSTAGFVRARDTAYDQSASNITLSSANDNNDAANYTLATTTATAAQSYKVNQKIVAAIIGAVEVPFGSDAVGTLSLGTGLVAGDQVNVSGTVSVSGAGTGGAIPARDTAYDQIARNVTLRSGNANNDADNYILSGTTVTAPGSYKVNRTTTLPNVVQPGNTNTAQASRVTLSAEPGFALSGAETPEKKEAANNLACMDFHLVDKTVPANAVTVCHSANN